MDDLINREQAIDELLKLIESRRGWTNTEDARKEISGIDASMCAIHDLPSATKKGKWLVYEVANTEEEQPIAWECSECGAVVDCKTKFCPECGQEKEV